MELLIALLVLAGLLAAVALYDRRKRLNDAGTEFSSPKRPRSTQSERPVARPAPGPVSPAEPGMLPPPAPPQPIPPPAPPQGWGSAEMDDWRGGEAEKPLDDELKPEMDDVLSTTEPPKGPIREQPITESAVPEPAPAPVSAPEPVSFSAYYPKEAAPELWLSMRAYVFRARAAAMVAADANRALGPQLDEYRPVTGEARIPVNEGALVIATPDLPGFQFNPPSASVSFYEDWHALDFKLRAVDAPLEQAANGRLTFTVEGVIVADLPLSVFVTRQPAAGSNQPANPTASPYEAIFCSYSHDDAEIVERVERAYRALGLNYLRDVTVLRSGEAWNARLLQFIEQADIFQLFWSEAAAHSPYVEQEWRYALALARGGSFIRPVYWEKPLPEVPGALRGLHFHYDGSLDDLGYNERSSG